MSNGGRLEFGTKYIVRQLRYWQSLKIGILADPQMAMSGFWLNRGAGNVRIYLSKI